MTMVERRENPDEGEETGAQVGERYPGLDGRAAGLAGNRHDAGDALGNEIESAFAALRAGLPVAGDRRVDETRVQRRQRLVVEAERRHHAGPIVLDYDVTRACKRCEDLPAFGRLEVEDHAAFPAVDGV